MEPLIVVVSNRGPFSFKRKLDGTFNVNRGTGGLVTALGGLAEKHDVLWVAAALSKDDYLWLKATDGTPQNVEGISLQLMQPKKKPYQLYYNEIANPMLWFIQHQLWDTPRNPSITQETWEAWDDGKWSSGMSFKFQWMDKKEGHKFYNYEISEKEAFIEIL